MVPITVGSQVKIVGNTRGQGQTARVLRVDAWTALLDGFGRRPLADLIHLDNPGGVNQYGGPYGAGDSHGPKDVMRIAGIIAKSGGDAGKELMHARNMAKSIDSVEKAQARADAAHAAGAHHIAAPFLARVAELGGSATTPRIVSIADMEKPSKPEATISHEAATRAEVDRHLKPESDKTYAKRQAILESLPNTNAIAIAKEHQAAMASPPSAHDVLAKMTAAAEANAPKAPKGTGSAFEKYMQAQSAKAKG